MHQKLSLSLVSFIFSTLFLYGCSTTPCKIEERTVSGTDSQNSTSQNLKQNPTGGETSMAAEKDLTSRVRIYKADGSQQCGTSKKIDLSVMQKELGFIKVFSAENKNDGLMRIQMCGHPTGNCNVYEIFNSDLDAALKLGYKKWIRD